MCFVDPRVEQIFMRTFDMPMIGKKIRQAIAHEFAGRVLNKVDGFSMTDHEKNGALQAMVWGQIHWRELDRMDSDDLLAIPNFGKQCLVAFREMIPAS